MLESKNPEIDVTQLLEKIGLELKLQQKKLKEGGILLFLKSLRSMTPIPGGS